MESYVKPALFWCLFLALTIASVHLGSTSKTVDKSAGKDRQGQLAWSRGVFCFEDKCTCYNTTANCSQNHGNLTYIPKLNYRHKIRNLVFSDNNLTTISTDIFFNNVSEVRVLDLRNNDLQEISPGAFRPLTKLSELFLDNNKLTYDTLLPVFSAKALRNLTARNMMLGELPIGYFFRNPMPQLSLIDISDNRLHHLKLFEFNALTGLEYLYVHSSRVTRLDVSAMPYLRQLLLGDNALYDFVDSCTKNSSSLFPNLALLDFSDNKFSSFSGKRICLPNLQTLSLNKNNIQYIETDMFGEHRFPSLLQLSLESIPDIKNIEKYAFRNPKLQILELGHCRIKFKDLSMNLLCFAGSPHLAQLKLDHNYLSGMSVEQISQLFGQLKNLTLLQLGHCRLRSVSKQVFPTGMRRLSSLFLNGNKLTDLPDGVFDSFKNLTELSLHSNRLHTVQESLFSPELRGRLARLVLSGNPFICDCNLLWFQKWFVSSPSLFDNYTYYTCTNNLDNIDLMDFAWKEAVCFFSRDTLKAMIACVVLFVLTLVGLAVVYQYRWHIRLKLTFRNINDFRSRRLENSVAEYDIFVSCAEEDQCWVEQNLVPHLEGRLGLRLCLQNRDTRPNKPVIKNILEGLESSRKIMAVFSKHYAQDPMCQFELDVCLTEVVDYNERLVVVCVGDVTPRDLTSTMMAVMNTTMYIQWQYEPGTRKMFWKRLHLCLRGMERRRPRRENPDRPVTKTTPV